MRLTAPKESLGVIFFLTVIGIEILSICVLFGMRISTTSAMTLATKANTSLVAQLGLTDLALWSEARYTRHLSQADIFSAFGDHPSSLEHFPSGSFAPPMSAYFNTSAETPVDGGFK